jgi:hypothetical protein
VFSTDLRSGDGPPQPAGTWNNVPVPPLKDGLGTIRDSEAQDVLKPLNAQPPVAR